MCLHPKKPPTASKNKHDSKLWREIYSDNPHVLKKLFDFAIADNNMYLRVPLRKKKECLHLESSQYEKKMQECNLMNQIKCLCTLTIEFLHIELFHV